MGTTYQLRVVRRSATLAVCALAGWLVAGTIHGPHAALSAQAPADANEFNDSHFHLTNYIQEGISVPRVPEDHGNRVGRSTLFGIPLQQQWSYGNSGTSRRLTTCRPMPLSTTTRSPTPYIASAYRSLSEDQQARFDPMITGFNPADMYAVDHIRRVLQTFPGVFTGLGEFTIHKEFVSAKISGETASLTNPALDRILDFAAEVGLVVHPSQRHRHAVRQDGRRPGVSRADEGAAHTASEDHDHLGACRSGPDRSSDQRVGRSGSSEPWPRRHRGSHAAGPGARAM